MINHVVHMRTSARATHAHMHGNQAGHAMCHAATWPIVNFSTLAIRFRFK